MFHSVHDFVKVSCWPLLFISWMSIVIIDRYQIKKTKTTTTTTTKHWKCWSEENPPSILNVSAKEKSDQHDFLFETFAIPFFHP